MSKSKKILILLGALFAFSLFFSLKSHAYCWPVANSNGTIDYSTTYIEYGYGKRVYTVDKGLWPNEGNYSKTENHHGIDITGTPNATYRIVSVSNGTVLATSANRASYAGISFPNNNQRQGSRSSDGGGYGNYLLIKDNSSGFVFLYAHLAPNTITVKKGDSVKMGQILGTMGSSGDAGHMHLHFEIRRTVASALSNPSSSKSNITTTHKFDYESSSSECINPVKYIYTYQMSKEFVTSVYKNALGRNPDSNGLKSWTNAMMNGTTPAQVITSFLSSTEFKNKNYNNNTFIEKMYNTCLQRGSDTTGRMNYLNLLKNGYSRQDVLKRLLSSTEFTNLCTSYYARVFVTDAYKNILGRSPDSSGLKSWTQNLASSNTPSNILYSFYNSAEFKNKKYNNDTYVEKLYNGCLQRNSDASGKKSHLNSLNSGTPRDKLLKSFLNSKEYKKLVAKNYGLSNVGI